MFLCSMKENAHKQSRKLVLGVPFRLARVCVVFLVVPFRMRRRLLPEVPTLASIPTTLADRSEDVNVIDETAIQRVWRDV